MSPLDSNSITRATTRRILRVLVGNGIGIILNAHAVELPLTIRVGDPLRMEIILLELLLSLT